MFLEYRFYYCTIYYNQSSSLYLGLLVKIISSFPVRNFHVNISMFCRHIQHLFTSPMHLHLSHTFSHKETLGCRHLGHHSALRHSVGVEGGGEDDVPADGQRGLLHLAPQDGVSHDAGSLPHLLQHLVQALDAAHHRALLDVCQLGDLCERL